jgi:RNA polymerase sigma-70 factor (ECF subfamily)
MNADELTDSVGRARQGDEGALAQLLRLYEPRLLRMVELRLDASLRQRLDPADVVQEGLLEAVRRFQEWCRQDALPIHVWLRLIVAQSLAGAQRRHLGAHRRDARLEVEMQQSRSSLSADNAADAFVASITSPSQAAQREELRAGVLAALNALDELDREVVVLRHFEGLSTEEVAAELAMTPVAASKRFVRALLRLRPALESFTSARPGELP